MVSLRLALLVLFCTVVAVQSQSQFPSRRFTSRKTSSSVSGQTSPRARTSFTRTNDNQSSSRRRSSTSTSFSGGRTSVSKASSGRSTSRRRLGSGAVQTTSQLSSRAGGFSSGRPSSSRSSSSSSRSSSSSSSSSSFTSRKKPARLTSSSRRQPARAVSSSRRQPARPASKPAFSRTRPSSFSSSSSASRPSSSSFNRQRPSTVKSSSKPTFGSARRKTTTNKRPSSSRGSSFSGSSAFGRGSSSAFGRGSSSAFGRGSSSSRTRSQTRPQSGSSAFRSGAQKKKLLKKASTVNFNCPEPDGFFADKGQCDKYFECKEGVAKEHTCPDGLLFHPERSYPCVYPVEADCKGRSQQQDPQPTEGCPRQFATFKATEDQSCGAFTRCINGRAYPSGCPEGLAFDARTLGCEYADMVEGCDAPAYLGFQCPAREFTPDQVGEFTREQHPNDCTKFYVCVNKEDGSIAPRLQGCPEPAVFDPVKRECNTNPQEVAGCEDAIPETVLAAYRQRDSDEQDRRATRLAELRAKLQG